MIFLFFLALFLPFTAYGTTLPLDTCYACHDTHKNVRHGNITCTECHRNIESLPHDEKLEKPKCGQCHNAIQPAYNRSVHASRNMKCIDCHDAHSPSREKKNCQQCHVKPQHRTLPSAKKHLSTLSCGACHGDVQKSSIDVSVSVKNGKPPAKSAIDLDNNNILDKKEWDNLLGLLQKDAYKIDTKYFAKGDDSPGKQTGNIM